MILYRRSDVERWLANGEFAGRSLADQLPPADALPQFVPEVAFLDHSGAAGRARTTPRYALYREVSLPAPAAPILPSDALFPPDPGAPPTPLAPALDPTPDPTRP